MKVLYITNKPIYPKIDGGCVAMDNFLRCLLHGGTEVKHLLIETQKHPFSLDNYPSDLVGSTQPEGVFVDTKVTAKRAFSSLFKSGSYNVNRFYSQKMEALILRTLASMDVDLIILESLYVTPYLSAIRSNFNGKVYLRTHNIESDIWSQLAATSSSRLTSNYQKKLSRDLKKYELETLRSVDGLLTISSDDSLRLAELNIHTPSTYIPVTIDLTHDVQADYSKHDFFHLGALNWLPNRTAVDRLLHIFPAIKRELPRAELHIAGQGATADNLDVSAGTHLHGFVDDLQQFAVTCGILVSPITSGSGIRIKLLEAMAIGIPCITTERGAAGIDWKNHRCLMIAETDDAIVSQCVELAKNASLREEIGQNARDYIRKNHNIDLVSSELIEFIQST